MPTLDLEAVAAARQAAVEVLLNNARGPFHGLMRTAAWGYPEPYTRDLMISALGILASGEKELIAALRKVFLALARHQTSRGHIPSLAHDGEDRGASDTTPLFLMALAIYRRATGERDFLDEAAQKALTWMDYQSPGDRVIVGQMPTTDWRDEQWVLGFGLYVNAVVQAYLRLFGLDGKAELHRAKMRQFVIEPNLAPRHRIEGLAVPHKPYYALWSYKIYHSERFDLLGNSLAILSGLAPPSRADHIITWIERECREMRERGQLALDLPPNFFPFIDPGDPDWMPRYAEFNQPGEYHNGGAWPFVCGFYIAAAVAAGHARIARRNLAALTALVRQAREREVEFGFNEWHRAQDGRPCGQDWQTWSAAMYLYAAACVEQEKALFFDEILNRDHEDEGRMTIDE